LGRIPNCLFNAALKIILCVGADISIYASTAIALRIDRWEEGLIRIHNFSQQAENHLSQIPELLLELGFIFEKWNFNVGADPCPSEE
jgi:hypothetical protein